MHKRDNAFVNMQKCTDDLMKELTQTSHIDEYLKNNDKYIITENLSSFICDRIAEKGAGTVIILQVTVPSAPEGSAWSRRVMELNRDSTQSAWYFRTEGPV